VAAARKCIFLDTEDDRGKVVYLRFDGDYGLVQAP
jgi:hypothetical protein